MKKLSFWQRRLFCRLLTAYMCLVMVLPIHMLQWAPFVVVPAAVANDSEPDPEPDPPPCEGDGNNEEVGGGGGDGGGNGGGGGGGGGGDVCIGCGSIGPDGEVICRADSNCSPDDSGGDDGDGDCDDDDPCGGAPGDGGGGDCDDCPEDGDGGDPGTCGTGSCSPATTTASPFTTGNPVYLRYGTVVESAVDIRVRGPGISWKQSRTYDSQLAGERLLGNRWMSDNTDYHLLSSNENIELVNSASSKAIFEPNGSGFASPQGWSLELTHDATNKQYVVTGEGSNATVSIFHDFTVSPAELRGKLKEVTREAWRAAGKSGLVYAYNSSGELNQLTTSDGQALGVFFTRSNGKLLAIEVREGATVIQQVTYSYFENVNGISPDVGSAGDLVSVTRSKLDSQGNWIHRHTQYRYDNDGHIKAVFSNDSIQQILNAGDASTNTTIGILQQGDDYLVNGGASIEKYSSKWFTYYASDELTNAVDTFYPAGGSAENLESNYGGANRDETGFVKSERVGSCGCSSCGGSDGTAVTYHYYYMGLDQGPEEDDNEVRYIIVEDAVDTQGGFVNRKIHGLNARGRQLRQAFVAFNPGTTTPLYWCSSKKLTETSEHTSAGKRMKRYKIIESRPPSAHNVTSLTQVKQFLDPYDDTGSGSWTNDTNTLRDQSDVEAGPTYTFEFNDAGKLLARKVKRGYDDTTEDYLSAREYGDGTNAPESLMTASYSYRTQTSVLAAGDKSSITYEFWDAEQTQMRKRTITYPIIPVAENGSGVAATTEEYFDRAGRLRWTRNGEGYVNYYSYHVTTGRMGYAAKDVDPGSLPASASDPLWIAPIADGASEADAKPTRGSGLPSPLALVTTQEYDNQGRKTLLTNPGGDRHYKIYEANRKIWLDYLDANGQPQLPIRVAVKNDAGKTTETHSVRADFTGVSTAGGVPTGFSTEPTQADYVSWTRYAFHEDTEQVAQVDRYHKIPDSGVGVVSDNFYRMVYQYDSRGRRQYVVQQVSGSPDANGVEQIDKTNYDALGRIASTERGVSQADHNMGVDYSNYPLLAKVSENFYDGSDDTILLKVGDNRRTSTRNYYGTGANEFMQIELKLTILGHMRGYERKNGTTSVSPYFVKDVDWQGRAIATAQYTTAPNWATVLAGDGYDSYAATQNTNRNNLSKTFYNSWASVYRNESYLGAEDAKHFEVNNYYDHRGNLVATGDKHAAHTEYAFDGAGRQYQQRTVLDVSSSTPYDANGQFTYNAPAPHSDYSAMSGGDGGVIELAHTEYNTAGNAIVTHNVELNHNDTDGFSMSGGVVTGGIRSTEFLWYDVANRVTTMANYGSGDGASSNNSWQENTLPAYDAKPASSSGFALVAKFGYHPETGRQDTVTIWQNSTTEIVTKTFYDDFGRQKLVVENWQAGFDPAAGSGTTTGVNRTTGWLYNGLGQTTQLTAYNNSSSGNQVTNYEYTDPHNASLVTKTIYPDGDLASDNVTRTYNLDGSLDTVTDQRSIVHTYTYNNRRQLAFDAVSNLPSSVDSSIQAIGRDYDTLGRLTHVTSYSDVSGSSIANQIEYTRHAHGKLLRTYQSHSGVASVNTYHTRHLYDESAVNGVYDDGLRHRLTDYPLSPGSSDPISLAMGYGNHPANDRLHRVYTHILHDGNLNSDTQRSRSLYSYNGTGRLVSNREDFYSSGNWSVVTQRQQVTVSNYDGFDRFGRTVRQRWQFGTTHDQHNYTYDYAGNRLTRDNALQATLNQTYTYDGLHRLASVDENQTAGNAGDQHWTLDQLGNWEETRDNATGTGNPTQARTHNAANELESVTNMVAPAHDNAGNMTTIPQPKNPGSGYTATYDAWNRLVSLSDTSGVVQSNQYDGLNRRIVRTEGGESRHFYYNEKWQVLTESVENGSTEVLDSIYRYHPHYVDAVAARIRANDAHIYTCDANYNVTAAIDAITEQVVERYHYSPYGKVTFLDSSFIAQNSSLINNEYLYTGRRLDPEAGLQLNRNRFYAPHLGRWVNRDPIGYEGSKWNLYEYVSGRPLDLTDPNGLSPLNAFPPMIGAPRGEDGMRLLCKCRKITLDTDNRIKDRLPKRPKGEDDEGPTGHNAQRHCILACELARTQPSCIPIFDAREYLNGPPGPNGQQDLNNNRQGGKCGRISGDLNSCIACCQNKQRMGQLDCRDALGRRIPCYKPLP